MANDKCKTDSKTAGDRGTGSKAKKQQIDEAKNSLKTIQSDPRYNQCNCSSWCFDNFVLSVKCNRLLGESHESCELFAKYVQATCPNEWVRKWERQVEEGTFPADIPEME